MLYSSKKAQTLAVAAAVATIALHGCNDRDDEAYCAEFEEEDDCNDDSSCAWANTCEKDDAWVPDVSESNYRPTCTYVGGNLGAGAKVYGCFSACAQHDGNGAFRGTRSQCEAHSVYDERSGGVVRCKWNEERRHCNSPESSTCSGKVANERTTNPNDSDCPTDYTNGIVSSEWCVLYEIETDGANNEFQQCENMKEYECGVDKNGDCLAFGDDLKTSFNDDINDRLCTRSSDPAGTRQCLVAENY